METQTLIEAYYAAFNAGNVPGMLACVADDLRHEVNQGKVRNGKAAFGSFCAEMNAHYREKLEGITIMVAPGGARVAAEFWVNGAYLKTSAGSPPAHGQRYRLRAGTFFEIANGKITRVTTYYNAADWLRQVSVGGDIAVRALKGPELHAALPALAQLRITVFRDYPYLYDGDPGYEKKYLDVYAKSEGAIIVAAFDGERIVGAATAAPMEDHAPAFAKTFKERGYNPEDILYCGESVLLPEYRGRGIGHKFFDLREAHGRALGRTFSAFCGVVRPEDHPLCPPDYHPLDAFWEKRGYRKLDGFIAHLSWPDIGEPAPTEKPMQFWIRAL
ncbi:MAG: ketosteroid isomerase-related protein [Alphaproteobacteria bacterium]